MKLLNGIDAVRRRGALVRMESRRHAKRKDGAGEDRVQGQESPKTKLPTIRAIELREAWEAECH